MFFKEIVGQQSLINQLREEIVRDKISHAQLFLGENGYGSLALALAYVQYLMCTNRSAEDSCGTCSACQKNKQLIHPDVHYIFPTVQVLSKTSDPELKKWREQILETAYFSETQWINRIDKDSRSAIIGVDEAKELTKKISLTAFEGGYRVFIIWKAENMNTTFANKLLKTLEEPLSKTLIILVSEDANRLLPTVISRTQRKKIPKLSFDETVHYLIKSKGINPQIAQSLTGRLDCNLADILEVAQESAASDQNRELFIEMMRSCYKKNVIEMMDWAEKVGSLNKEVQKEYLSYSLHMFRQSILRNYTGEQLFNVSDEEGAFLQNFSKFISGNNLAEFMECFSEGLYHLERNANAKILFTDLCFKTMRYIHFA
ncbi:MAG: DNA polymerase III subunit delta [Bacteroidetes bacterium]|nr:DNA polymerase III subunit delta [Bacteroidota bacterium]